jgi:hypothetical protein
MTSLATKRVLVVMLALGLAGGVEAEQAVGLGSFVRLGASSRGIALGRAYTALAGGDALGFFWNPAAVADGLAGPRFAVSNRFFGDSDVGMGGALSFVTAGGSIPVWNRFVLGLGIMHLGVPGIEQYDERAVLKGEFSDSESLFVMSLGRSEGPIAVGLNVKFLYQGFSGLQQIQGATSGSGLGFDMGLIARFWKPVRIGVSLRDQIDIDRDRSPMTAILGVSFDRPVYIGIPAKAVGAIDFEQIKKRPLRLHMGIGLEEIPAASDILLALRLGRSNRMIENRLSDLLTGEFRGVLDEEDLVGASAQWALGVGLRRGQFRLDYTLSFGKLHDPQYISLGYDL